VAALTLLGLAAAVPHALDYIYDKIDVIIFKKSESESYAGRTEWTRVAWEAFFATDGLGVGLGSARTSNWFVALLSNTGIYPALIFPAVSQRGPANNRICSGVEIKLTAMVRDVSGFLVHARFGRRGCFNIGIDFNLNADRWDVVNPVRGHDCAPNTSPKPP
jgi:hypothetical protein